MARASGFEKRTEQRVKRGVLEESARRASEGRAPGVEHLVGG